MIYTSEERMKYLNGFFQLDIRQDGTYAHIYPAKEGGKRVSAQEFVEYIEKCGIKNYDLVTLNKEISQVTEETDIFVSKDVISEVNETAKVSVTSDRMMVYIRFYPPSKNGKYMTEKDIINELTREKIKYGVSGKVVKAYLLGRQFCRDIPIAKGKAVVQGKDAVIDYKFDTCPTAKPKLNEDGSVDFHELNLFTSVKAGDLLAQLTPEDLGEEGIDVFGNKILPYKVRKKVLKYGRNIRISEDKLSIYSEVDGDVKLEQDTVFVSNTYSVAADVDASTGDIDYNGNVTIAGNVRSGFTVKATGDIEVNGIVEGATLIAGGNIVLKRGAQGMGKGILDAQNDIVTKFIESCTVKAGHVINTGSSLHSNLTAGESVVVSGKKGFLIGGTISAGQVIEACVIGNKMNTQTILKVGVEPEVMDRFKDLSISIKEKQEEILNHQQVLNGVKKKLKEGKPVLPNQVMLAKQASERLTVLNEELEKESEEYINLKQEIENNKDGRVLVDHVVFPGVCIYISNRIYPVKDNRSRCQFRIDGADIITLPL